MADDITQAICNQLLSFLTLELQTNISTSDPLRARIVDRWPLQDDPTTRAPYVLVAPDIERGQIPDPEQPPEIGGGSFWVDFVTIEGRIPQQKTKALAYQRIGQFRDRIVRAVLHYGNLNGVATDDGQWYVWGCRGGPQGPLARSRLRIFGGEGEFFGEVFCELFYRSYYTGPCGQ